MRRKLTLSWSEAVVITAGNLLTIFLFAFNKKRPARKSLFLVMNMAFADLLLGGVCLPLFVCVLATRNQCSSSFSYYHSYGFIAGFVYHHRCFDISWEILRHLYYWPLKHLQREHTHVLFGRRGYWLSLFPRYMFCHSWAQWLCTLSLIYTACFFLWLSAARTSAFGESFSKKLFLVTKTEPCKFSV